MGKGRLEVRGRIVADLIDLHSADREAAHEKGNPPNRKKGHSTSEGHEREGLPENAFHSRARCNSCLVLSGFFSKPFFLSSLPLSSLPPARWQAFPSHSWSPRSLQ
jgi:hypothetical protein